MALTLILSHGMESGPGATKISALAEVAQARGITALRPDYRDQPDWRDRLERLKSLITQQDGLVLLVGSSIGAYISALASCDRDVAGLFLLAPPIEALPTLPALRAQAAQIWIAHGWHDELIDPLQVFEFSRRLNARLTLLNSDHRLSDCVPTLTRSFEEFLDGFAP